MNLNNIVFEISNQLLFEMSKVFNNEQINLAVIFNPTEGGNDRYFKVYNKRKNIFCYKNVQYQFFRSKYINHGKDSKGVLPLLLESKIKKKFIKLLKETHPTEICEDGKYLKKIENNFLKKI